MTWRRWGCWLWLVCLPLLTCVRVPLWQDEQALWLDAARKAPQKVRPVLNAGKIAHERGDSFRAQVAYEYAITLAANPERPVREQQVGWAVATTNLAILAVDDGRHAEARTLIASVRARFPNFKQAEQVAYQIHGWNRR